MTDEETPKELAERKIMFAVGDASLALWEIGKLTDDAIALPMIASHAADIYGMRRRIDDIITKIELREVA